MNPWIKQHPWEMVAYVRLLSYTLTSAAALTACSKSPSSVVATTANSISKRLMQPIVQNDASIQAKRMAELLSNKPACAIYKERMIEAGKGSPYDGVTQWKIVHTQQDACAAGCCK